MPGRFSKIFSAWWLLIASQFLASALDNPPIIWTTRIGTLSDSSPAVAQDGTIYVGSFDGKFWALNPDGSVKWIFSTGREIKSSPAVAADGTVYFGSRDRKFYAVNPNGREKWHFQTGAWVDSSAALSRDGTIYFGSWDRNFYALNPDGSQKWRLETGGVIDSSPAIGLDGIVYFGSHDHVFYAAATNGTVTWIFRTGGPIASSPAIDSERSVCITSVDGYCYNLNLNGSVRWKVRTGGITWSSPVFGQNGSVYLAVNDRLWIIPPGGRKAEGTFRIEDADSSTPVAFSDATVGILTGWGNLYRFQPAPPDLRWDTPFFIQSRGSPGMSVDGMVYLPGVYAVRSGLALGRSSWPKFRGNPRNTGNVADNTAATVK